MHWHCAVLKITIKATNSGRFNVHTTVLTQKHNINEICAYFNYDIFLERRTRLNYRTIWRLNMQIIRALSNAMRGLRVRSAQQSISGPHNA